MALIKPHPRAMTQPIKSTTMTLKLRLSNREISFIYDSEPPNNGVLRFCVINLQKRVVGSSRYSSSKTLRATHIKIIPPQIIFRSKKVCTKIQWVEISKGVKR